MRAVSILIIASQEGFEPPTDGLEGRCSILLSYWDVSTRINYTRTILSCQSHYKDCIYFITKMFRPNGVRLPGHHLYRENRQNNGFDSLLESHTSYLVDGVASESILD